MARILHVVFVNPNSLRIHLMKKERSVADNTELERTYQ